MELDGSVAVVTGGASGIGRACALAFAEAGADIVLSDVNLERMAEVADAIRSRGRDVLTNQADVSVRSDIDRLVDESIEWKGHCDLFMSNAGAGMHGPPHKMPLSDYEWALDVNVWPHVWAQQRVLPHMIERGRGHLVHTASAAGLIGSAHFAPYCLSKFAVVGLAESLAIYLGGTGVGVSVVCPMLVNTNLGERTHMTFEDPIDSATEAGLRSEYKAMLEQAGIPPEAVGSVVIDAVLHDRFWVFPHPEVLAMMAEKWRDPEAWIQQQKAGWQSLQMVMEPSPSTKEPV